MIGRTGSVDSGARRRETDREEALHSRETRNPRREEPCEGQHSKARRHNASLSICVSPVTPADGYRLGGSINGVPTSLLLDTGAAVTLIHRDTWARTTSHPQELTSWPSLKLGSADGSPLTVHGRARVNLQVEGETMAIDAAIVSPLTTEAILGLDFLREHKALIDIPQKQLYLGDKQCMWYRLSLIK